MSKKDGPLSQDEINALLKGADDIAETETGKIEDQELKNHNQTENNNEEDDTLNNQSDEKDSEGVKPQQSTGLDLFQQQLKQFCQKKLNRWMNMPVKVDLSLGKAQLSLNDIADLQENSTLELDTLINSPVELKIGEITIGTAEVVVMGEYFGIRILSTNYSGGESNE